MLVSRRVRGERIRKRTQGDYYKRQISMEEIKVNILITKPIRFTKSINMKILKTIIFCLFLFPLATTAQDKKGELLNVSEITVKFGHESQFIEGVKLFNECYLKNKGTDHWNIWRRVQGNGTVYVLAGPMVNWAEMDKKDPAGDACRQIVNDFILPNVESTSYSIAQNMPKISSTPVAGNKLIWVTFFNVKNSVDFKDFITTMEDAIKTTEGNYRGYWYQLVGGGPESANYFITEPFKGFADLDKDRDGIWKIYEKVNGKKAADALRIKSRNAIDKSWSYMYTLSEDLSN